MILTHTHTQTLSLSLTHIHTNTHTPKRKYNSSIIVTLAVLGKINKGNLYCTQPKVNFSLKVYRGQDNSTAEP